MLTTGVDTSASLMGFDAMSVIGRVCVFSGYSFLGFAMKRLDLFSKKDGLVMLKFVVNVTLPALLLHTLSTSASMYTPHVNNGGGQQYFMSKFLPIVLCSAFVSLTAMGSALYLYFKRPSNERGLFVGSMAGVNLGTYSYPFIEAIWGSEGLRLATLYDLPNSVFVFIISAVVFSYERSKTRKSENVELRHDDGGMYSGEFITERIKKETYAKRSSANVSEEEDARMTKDNGLSSIAKRKEQLEKENEQTGPKTTFTTQLVKSGLGCYTYPSGAIYEGEWQQNVKNGLGVYKYAKGGSYVGNFKSGEFSGFGVRKLRSGVVKAGIWKANELEKIVPMEELTATVRDATLRAEAARMKVESLKEETLKKKALNMLKFPPFIALAVVFVSKIIGHSLPTVVHKLAEPLANANNPLVLITVGVLFEAGLRRQQTRDCIGFLAAKYATGLACAAVVSVFIPSGFPIARGTLAALCVMPVPSVVVQQAVKNNLDADLAASLVSGSQIASVVMLLFFAATMNLASRPFLFPFCLLILAGVVASAGYFLDEYLSPSPHTTFKGAVADKIDTMLDVIFKNNAKEEDVLSIDRGNSDSKNSNSGSDSIDENEAAAKNDEDSSSRGPNAPNARSLSNERFLNNFWPKRYAFQAKLSLDSRLRGRGGGGRRPKKINSYSASPTRTTTLKVIGLAAGTKKTDIKTRMIRTTRTAECTRRTFLPLRTTPLFL
jgi:predicted permease